MKRLASAAMALALTAALPAVWAQSAQAAQPDNCPSATELQAPDLHGIWQLVLWPEGSSESAPVSTASSTPPASSSIPTSGARRCPGR